MSNDLSGFREVSLGDKYDLSHDSIYLTGTQALVRLCLIQAARDAKDGLRTGGYVTGYRGSPLGGLDQQFGAAHSELSAAGIVFQAGLNEELAATAVWGTQQVAIRGEGAVDGVFALWYGKGPGVDRSGDAFRHANLAGSAETGGVVVLMGDDHTCESSTTCHQSEYALVDAMMPVLNPANIEEIVELGLHGWALSRFSGLWVGLKCVKDNVESSASVSLPLDRPAPVLPEIEMPPGGLNIRPADDRHEQERRLHRHKLDAARAYARANGLDRAVWRGGEAPKVGVVSTGKSWMDLATALEELGLDETRAGELGLTTYKVAMVWPLEPEGLRAFAQGLDLLIVVEEKRGLIESQAREILYGLPGAPRIVGKRDEAGATLFPADGALDPVMIARALAERLPGLEAEAARLAKSNDAPIEELGAARTPYFCAGCPHNRSTVLPEGARGYAGIGCHWMAQMMDRSTEGYTHMGCEGANWIGEAPFSTRGHVFQNLGDGTYNHSGLLAIRAAIAARVTMTYKILYNDAVAMTGGQAHEGGLPPAQIAAEVLGAGAARLVVVTDDPGGVDPRAFPAGVKIHHRDDLQDVQAELAKGPGVTVLLNIQTCATELRRRRKRGLAPVPTRRVMINPEICEGCGDCGLQSNCVAIVPVETPLGRKRAIDQSACNRDLSCLKGFCPSFVTIEGGSLRRPEPKAGESGDLPHPAPVFSLERPVSLLLTGVGGTGVVTVGAILGMAAHLEGKGVGLIDMAGLAQKGGPVTTHIRLAAAPGEIKAIRIAPGSADLLLGCDALTSAGADVLRLLAPDAHVVANTHEIVPGSFVQDRDFTLPGTKIRDRLRAAAPPGQAHLVDATKLARDLLGDTIGANLFLLGAAWQAGLVPLSEPAIAEAIRLNGTAVDFNLSAFHWGRAWAVDPASVEGRVAPPDRAAPPTLTTLAAVIADREDRLTLYQNEAYAARYRIFVEGIAAKETAPGHPIATAVARNLYKLMAYKDEYEVARLITDGTFDREIAAMFDGAPRIRYHMAPPILAGRDPANGRPKKRAFGPGFRPVLTLLARIKGLRGTWVDPFGYSRERRRERQLIADYRACIERALPALSPDTAETILSLAELPTDVRGFGPVKAEAIDRFYLRRSELLDSLQRPRTHEDAA